MYIIELFANLCEILSNGSLDATEIINNAGELILKLWMRREEPLLSLLYSQTLKTVRCSLYYLIQTDEIFQ